MHDTHNLICWRRMHSPSALLVYNNIKDKYLLVIRACGFKLRFDITLNFLLKYSTATTPNVKTHKIEAKVTKIYNGINALLSFSFLLGSRFDLELALVDWNGRYFDE